MNRITWSLAPLAGLVLAAGAFAQPPGVTPEMIARSLPLEGAPLAIPGPYEVVSEAAYGAPALHIWRPADLSAFPRRDTLPVMAWGNGGCAIDGMRYNDFLSTIASHGFLVVSTVPTEGGPRQANSDLLRTALDWADAEATRSGSPLNGKIATNQMAVMGQSCGGFMSIELGADPRVGTIGVFNSGVNPPSGQAAPGARATTDALTKLHGPVMFINGGEVDFMYGPSRDNYDRVQALPAFYGARDNAGHTATVFHPGGGEYANVASNWLSYIFKGDRKASRMFVGDNCDLCKLDTWETASKNLD
jgi:hypothetical protein